MSLDTDGFDQPIHGGTVNLTIQEQHPLIKLANALPWPTLLDFILSDLKRTEKQCWWRGRPLRVRIHLGIYLLQQLLNLTDRQAEYALRDNAAFQLFCGVGLLEKWHAPDHTKIEAFRSRLTPETQRQLANQLAVHAVKLNYACPTQLDVDSTVQEANISPVSSANLLVKTAQLAKRIAVALTQFNERRQSKPPVYHVHLTPIKAIVMYYFTLKRQKVKASADVLKTVMQSLWLIK